MPTEWGPWIAWNGGECPVDPDTHVQVCTDSTGVLSPDVARRWKWDGRVYSHIVAYRVRREPVRETVTTYVGKKTGWLSSKGRCPRDTHRITFDLIDGEPDCASVGMEKIND